MITQQRVEIPRQIVAADKSIHSAVPIIKGMNIGKAIVKQGNPQQHRQLGIMQHIQRLGHGGQNCTFRIQPLVDLLLGFRINGHAVLPEQQSGA